MADGKQEARGDASQPDEKSVDGRPASAAEPAAEEHQAAAEDQNKVLEPEKSEENSPRKELSLEEQQQKYKWYKCRADPATYGEGVHYWTQIESGESSWTEPTELYWIWSTETASIDSAAGLQYPGSAQAAQLSSAASTVPENYQGYNPRIHGNYDPNADYARFHQRAQQPGSEADPSVMAMAYQQPTAATAADVDPAYVSTMVLNRFSGATQMGDRGPERHSDAAKSARQMNAFFDVDAAANAHEGRSLKAERQAQRLTKQQIKEFNSKRAERKHKKRMQNLLS